ncbi:MAG: hypothetical protein U5K76_12105 [Woeseiaceae bacterium]|nr:hypothetical protein [Woeseiaceae bacterium]
MADAIARSGERARNLLLLLIILPFWISFLLRVYAWMGLLNNYGVVNNLLMWIGLIDQPIQMMYTDFAVYIGPGGTRTCRSRILPLYATLERLDWRLVEAAMDLGAGPFRAFVGMPRLRTSRPGRRRGLVARVHSGDRRVW